MYSVSLSKTIRSLALGSSVLERSHFLLFILLLSLHKITLNPNYFREPGWRYLSAPGSMLIVMLY